MLTDPSRRASSQFRCAAAAAAAAAAARPRRTAAARHRRTTDCAWRRQVELLPRPAAALVSEPALAEQLRSEKEADAGADRRFFALAKAWWRDYLQIDPAHAGRPVRLFARDEGGASRPVCHFCQPLGAGRALRSPGEAARFVSLLDCARPAAVGARAARPEAWLDAHAVLAARRGDVEEHAALLCSFLLVRRPKHTHTIPPPSPPRPSPLPSRPPLLLPPRSPPPRTACAPSQASGRAARGAGWGGGGWGGLPFSLPPS
jgi:hypothetical protein